MSARTTIPEEVRMIWRRILYCGLGCLIAVLLAVAVSYLLNRVELKTWGAAFSGTIIWSLGAAGFCVSTVLALRKYRLVPLSIGVSLLIGLVTYKVADEFFQALYPRGEPQGDEYIFTIGLGALGKFIDQHYGIWRALHPDILLGGFVASVLVVLFCAALSGNLRAFLGGVGAGWMMALGLLLWFFFFPGRRMFPSMLEAVVAMVFMIPEIFLFGAVLGGVIALGEYFAVHPSFWNPKAEIAVDGD